MINNNDKSLFQQSQKSGLSYNEAKEWIARTTGGHNTHIYSNTNVEKVREENNQSKMNNFPENKEDL